MATGTLEAVTIVGVTQNERGWYEIEVSEYDEPLTTKEKKLADAAKAFEGGLASVQVNVKQNGNFTNRFLNDVQASDGELPQASAPEGVEIPVVSKRDEREETQKRIQAQWAYGQALSVGVATGVVGLGEILDTETFAKVQAAAEVILLASKDLADKS